jgi:hypothetical protein
MCHDILEGMHYQKKDPIRAAPDSLRRYSNTVRMRRIGSHMPLHQIGISGIFFYQNSHRRLTLRNGAAEADAAAAADVVHKDVTGQLMLPTILGGAHAEIVLFTIAQSERLHIEEAGLLQAPPPDVHAEAHCRGDFDKPAVIH